jgi:DNA-3-methyladenine glycosylase
VSFLPLAFFARDARIVARALIGTYLVRVTRGIVKETKIVRIVETEAYRGPRDAACHARVGLTPRTRTLLGPPARAYVYFVYGMHDCFNVVCLAEGRGHAVLVRGAEPIAGIPLGVRTDGPARLTAALGITREDDGEDLLGGAMHLLPRRGRPKVVTSARVGVAYAGAIADAPWRFFEEGNRWVSRPPRKSVGRGGA